MLPAGMVELVDTLVLEASAARRESSSLSSGTNKQLDSPNTNYYEKIDTPSHQ